jgi:hypothetical protein
VDLECKLEDDAAWKIRRLDVKRRDLARDSVYFFISW